MSKYSTDKLTAEFKKNLKMILNERKNLTNAKKLSLESGLGETTVRDILQNRSASPKLETIYKISKALHVPIYRLIPSMIDQSYEELARKTEEVALLKNLTDVHYSSIEELRTIAKATTK